MAEQQIDTSTSKSKKNNEERKRSQSLQKRPPSSNKADLISPQKQVQSKPQLLSAVKKEGSKQDPV